MLKFFVLKVSVFLSIPLTLMILVGVTFPPTPRSSTSLLFAKVDKDVLLKESPSPRLIMIGGSNLSFGINSQMLKDSLNLNPINTGIHASIGLQYMMDDVLDNIQPKDIIIIAPEYQQFYGDAAYGRNELLRIVFDIDRESITTLNLQQWQKIIPYFSRFSISKLKPSEYFFQQSKKIGVYERRAFNQYGDVDIHWNHKPKKFPTHRKISDEFNNQIVKEMVYFRNKATNKGAIVYVTFPGYQDTSFENNKEEITKIEKELIKNNFILLGSPERYKMPNSMMYDTPYHLTKEGTTLRTQKLIEDLRNALTQSNFSLK
ncbi:MAG: hypothetical protein QNJ64_13215 [Crocosphaera sp.]|nr:hypothetical protein [Crocosphaera sp.]